LASRKIDEYTFISNFLENQYRFNVRIEVTNDENESKISTDKKTEL